MKKLLVVLAALAVLVILPVAGLAWLRADEAARHAAARELPPIEAPAPALGPDEEAWAHLRAAMGSADTTQTTPLKGALEATGQPEEALVDLWGPNVGAMEEVEQALARPGLTLPQVDLSGEEPAPDYVALLEVARAAAARGWETEDPVEAVAHMSLGLRLGHRITAANADLLAAMVGLALQDISVRELRERLDAGLSPEALDWLRGTLATMQDGPPVLVGAAARECRQLEQALAGVAEDPSLFGGVDDGSSGPSPWQMGLAFDLDTTVGWHRARCYADLAELTGEAPPVQSWPDPASASPLRRTVFNPMGRLLVEIVSPSVAGMAAHEAESRAGFDALLAALEE